MSMMPGEEILYRNASFMIGKEIEVSLPDPSLQGKTLFLTMVFEMEGEKVQFREEAMGISDGKRTIYFFAPEEFKLFSIGGIRKGSEMILFLIPKRMADDLLLFSESPDPEFFPSIVDLFSGPPWENFSFLQTEPEDAIFPPQRPGDFIRYLRWEKIDKKFLFNGRRALIRRGEEKAKVDPDRGTVKIGEKEYALGEEGCRELIERSLVGIYRGKDPVDEFFSQVD